MFSYVKSKNFKNLENEWIWKPSHIFSSKDLMIYFNEMSFAFVLNIQSSHLLCVSYKNYLHLNPETEFQFWLISPIANLNSYSYYTERSFTVAVTVAPSQNAQLFKPDCSVNMPNIFIISFLKNSNSYNLFKICM